MISSDNEDALNERANDLEAENFNGLERVIVRVAVPSYAELEVYFHNTLHRYMLVAAGILRAQPRSSRCAAACAFVRSRTRTPELRSGQRSHSRQRDPPRRSYR